MFLAAALVAAPVVAPPAPESRCTVRDDRLTELSGLAVVDDVLWAMDDGGRRAQAHRIDPDTCEVLDTRTSTVDPSDAEDLARGPDGELWVADIGDNDRSRDTVAVIVLPERGDARLHRLTYPDRPHDAEALLVDAAGRPVVITKDVGGAGIYRPDAPPEDTGPTPLSQVGTLTLPISDTSGGPIGSIGARVVTGAAVDAAARVVAVRTYTDAWLYPVPGDGDVVAALAGVPVRVPLPDEPQGEAIAFTADGALISGSEARGGVEGEIREVPGAVALAAAPATPGPPEEAAAAPAPPESPSWLPAVVGAGVLVAFLLVAAAALALRGALRR